MHPEFVVLIRALEKEQHTGAVIVTCGIRQVWEKILDREGLSDSVKVIGGGRVADGYVVDPMTKAALVSRLRDHHGLYVWAFGDSPMDLPMLKVADQAIVVVGEDQSRSRSMDAALLKAIDDDNLRARQALIPETSAPRLDLNKLPVVKIASRAFIDSITHCRRLQVCHATAKNAAKLLMTPTRDSAFAGPSLRAAHHRVGWYLVTEFLTSVLGLEEYSIAHVQGRTADGYRLRDEDSTVIVALMRGGEPMALGVSEVFPKAMFLHAGGPEDLPADPYAGYNQANRRGCWGCTGEGSLRRHGTAGSGADLSLVALRLSVNKFKWKGGTDTGNRLFNTTQLP